MNKIISITFVLLSFKLVFSSEHIDEDFLFSDTSSVIDSINAINKLFIDSSGIEKKSTSFSGDLTSALKIDASHGFLENFDTAHTNFNAFIVGNIMLDVRLFKGTKAFVNLETMYQSAYEQMLVNLREIFLDVNIKRLIYLRSGKQVLQWGRCHLWNPTDLINVEKKLFIQKIGYREGAYGFKIHIPFGTKANIYGFADTKDANEAKEIACAAKLEVCVAGIETAIAIWDKKNFNPVYGWDISTTIFDIMFNLEASASYGDNYYKIAETDKLRLIKQKEHDKWIPKICINATKLFDFLEIKDRISLASELYFNGGGYDYNIFADSKKYNYATNVTATIPGLPPIKIERDTTGTKKDFLLQNNLYEMNNYSRLYMAIFSNIKKFILSDLNFSLNGICNLEQRCFILSSNLNFQRIDNLNLGIQINSFLGPQNTEYTYHDNFISLITTVGLTF